METSSHDVLLVGGGGAALRAAIAISETNPKLSIAVVSKVYPMRSHTVSAEGGAAGVIGDDDTLDEHAYDTISGGDWLGDQDCVEIFVNEIPKELLRLEHWGCPWSREPTASVAVRPFGGMKKMRTWFAADKTGFHMLHTLFQTSLRYRASRATTRLSSTNLMVEDGRVCGVVAIELRTGKVRAITAKAVIVCTGGCGRVFPFTTNANICTGDGMALAYRAGAPLKDMEMVQYHPTGLPFTGILITEAARAEGGLLVNKDGYRYLQDYDLGKPQRRRCSAAWSLARATASRRPSSRRWRRGARSRAHTATTSISTCAIWARKRSTRSCRWCASCASNIENIDPVHPDDSGPPGAALHDGRRSTPTSTAATPLKGLYAAGEAACVSMNGANRLGSNSLGEILVFGARAGEAAAEYASRPRATALERRYWRRPPTRSGASSASTSARPAASEKHFGAARRDAADDGGRRGHLPDARRAGRSGRQDCQIKERYSAIAIDDHSLTFNTQLTAALELGFMLEVAETIMHSALAARGVARRPSAHRFPQARRQEIPRPFDGCRAPKEAPRSGLSAGNDHALAAGREGIRKVDRPMADTIILEVARFSPESDAEPRFKSYEVPLREDWMVLDALNYIKDQLDGTLTFRWSCRMGICGSCGMVVNGYERLTCETLPPGLLRPGRCGSNRCAISRWCATWWSISTDFMEKLERVKPWIVRKDRAPSRSANTCRRPSSSRPTSSTATASTALLCYSACPVYGLDPHFIGPAALALAHRYNLDSRDQGISERLDVLSQHDGIWDCTVIGECSEVCPKEVDPSLAIQEYKTHRHQGMVQIVPDAMGGK